MTEARQLALALPHPPQLGRADFLPGAANAAGLALVDSYPDWPNRVAILIGPAGAGKSHLGAIWREESGASAVAATALATVDLGALLAGGAVLVEAIDAPEVDQRALFHLLNLVRERSAFAVLTSRTAPADIGFDLPDLASRLRAAVPVTLHAPDDELLERVMLKLFADRQIAVDPSLVSYLSRRMERSFEAGSRIVAALDAEALAEGRPVTRQLAARVLQRLGADPT